MANAATSTYCYNGVWMEKHSLGLPRLLPPMTFFNEKKRKRENVHPYLAGNFAPIHRTQHLVPCSYSGTIPKEFAGGQYVRNGGNPVSNEDLGRDAHWFDGDGMLSGISFRRTGEKEDNTQPEFVNQYILTDLYLSTRTSSSLITPILPSIATLVNPMSSLFTVILRIFRAILLVALSHLPGSQQAIRKICVVNTSILYHDGRALATCESGPPMRVALPSLDTVGWFNGSTTEGEPSEKAKPGFGGGGLLNFMREWTTAHPRVDPKTGELILFHSTFVPPYVHYSIIPSTQRRIRHPTNPPRRLGASVAGVTAAKMMHDFGVSSTHTVILDLPLSLDPLNLAKNRPVVSYDPTSRSRFGVFPRYKPDSVRWFETNSCCIFHTANTWDSVCVNPNTGLEETTAVNMLACRLTSASLVYSAGDLAAPVPIDHIPSDQQEEEQCRLYYYQFSLSPPTSTAASNSRKSGNVITSQWALSAIPFEFPTLRDSTSMSAAKYIYGCSVSDSSFGAALGRAVKIDSLVKVDVETLIEQGKRHPPTQISGCVDNRTVSGVLARKDPKDAIRIFKMPPGWYAQEPRFVARKHGVSEDDGWLLSYVFDESQLGPDGACNLSAKSELWIIDARNMTSVVAKVHLPQRVPYGLHGNWFSEEDIMHQRPVESLRKLPSSKGSVENSTPTRKMWMGMRRVVEKYLA